MVSYDLIVIGGGPAGSTAASVASRLGLKTLILEKSKKGRDKFCAGGITYSVEKFLIEKISKEISETIELKIGGFVVISPKGRELIIKYSEKLRKYGGLVRRSVFDAKLMEIAESEGAELIEGKTVSNISKSDGEIIAETLDGEKYRSSYVILATGVQDKLGEKVGLPPFKMDQLGACWGTECPYDMNVVFKLWSNRKFIPIYLFFGVAPTGYGWVFPKKNHLNIGIGANLAYFRNHRKVFQNFLEIAKKAEVLPPDFKAEHDRAWLIPFGDVPRKKTYSIEYHLLAVGDAAGFVHPVTGEGLYGAIYGAAIAAETTKKALDANDPRILAEYEKRWWSEFGTDMFIYGKKIADTLYKSEFMMEMGVRVLMADEEGARRLGYLIAHYNNEVSKRMYERISGLNLLVLALKSLKAPMKVEYEV
ncbi:MAG: hypothetical protein B6U95_06830 [Thermofilum sp. ex4484_82]|nr:MAG: hypothetical protein B6U95_06830 [Thermofilum sp. ex4484_82]OYT37360.1 MAG: hypothetical protein B6U96_06825 [Archaeoglobales archaeon ex4484_92]